MSQLPPNIDAILASIRSRMSDGDGMPQPAALVMPVAEPAAVLAQAAAVPIEELGHTVIAGQERTLEQVVRALLEPMLKAWLDSNMPEIVEKMAQAEIKRLTGR